jgi:predicted DsbA family dithiol-disulfide isomerase
MSPEKIEISYYSDVLCVWAYVAQIRLETLKETFKEKIEVIPYHVTLFGDTQKRIQTGWSQRGGYNGFGEHVVEVCGQFNHVEINSKVWKVCQPKTSGNAHLFLKAVQLLTIQDVNYYNDEDPLSLLKKLEWEIRLAFFRDARDISDMSVLFEIAEQIGLQKSQIECYLNDGSAMSLLASEFSMREEHKLEGSPTYILNNNRQKLFGNVGYKIMEANVHELLADKGETQASWC